MIGEVVQAFDWQESGAQFAFFLIYDHTCLGQVLKIRRLVALYPDDRARRLRHAQRRQHTQCSSMTREADAAFFIEVMERR